MINGWSLSRLSLGGNRVPCRGAESFTRRLGDLGDGEGAEAVLERRRVSWGCRRSVAMDRWGMDLQ